MRGTRAVSVGLVILALLTVGQAGAQAAPNTDWPAYLNGFSHSSYNRPDDAITPDDAADLHPLWAFIVPRPTMEGQPTGGIQTTPVVAGGIVYVGAKTGMFYALAEATGTILWQQFLGFRPHLTCAAQGIISSATVVRDLATDRLVVYVAAPDGYLYALHADTGVILWKSVIAVPSNTVSDYFNWSSPTVVGSKVYVGISSQCDHPLVRGGEIEFDRATGRVRNTYFDVPDGTIGGSIWSSAAGLPDGSVVVTTGNEPNTAQIGDDYSVVRLDGKTLTKLDSWQIPTAQLTTDSDFGGSATPFTGAINGVPTPLVGACNKNGVYYTLAQANLAAGPVWTLKVGTPYPNDPNPPGQCDAAAAYDGTSLFIGGNGTTIGGTAFVGSVRRVSPDTGVALWETGLPGEVIGSPTLNGAGLLAAPMMGSGPTSDGVAIVNAKTGALVTTLPTSSAVFSQPVFANGKLFVAAGAKDGLVAYAP
jgi:hypothetical protein